MSVRTSVADVEPPPDRRRSDAASDSAGVSRGRSSGASPRHEGLNVKLGMITPGSCRRVDRSQPTVGGSGRVR